MAERIFNFQTRIGRNSGTPEYRFGKQLSPLSDGPINGSQQLVIYELWQSEFRPVVEILLRGILRACLGFG
jgi:hypothetical protein